MERQAENWKKIKTPEIVSHTYTFNLLLTKMTRQFNGKRKPLLTNDSRTRGYSCEKKEPPMLV